MSRESCSVPWLNGCVVSPNEDGNAVRPQFTRPGKPSDAWQQCGVYVRTRLGCDCRGYHVPDQGCGEQPKQPRTTNVTEVGRTRFSPSHKAMEVLAVHPAPYITAALCKQTEI